MRISNSIVVNIGEEVIKPFLKEKGVSNEKLVNGKSAENLISDLIDNKQLNIDDVKYFFFQELMFGKRRYMRIFNLDKSNKIMYEEDWYDVLNKEYNIPSLEFNNIISTLVSVDEPKKIAAIHTEYNEKREINKISILFVCYIAMKSKGNSCCYIPVEFDLMNKLIVIKAWRRQGIADDEKYKPAHLMDKTIAWFEKNLNYSKKSMSDKHKKTLYSMNKGLVTELFDKIPSYEDSIELDKDIDNFSYSILKKMNLENRKLEKDGTYSLPIGVMDIKDELLKLIQRIAVSDYFMNREYDEVWNMGISAIVNSVKFNDRENVLAVVSGEEKRKPVFCSKSFLVLLKSIEESKAVDTIWIAFKYDNKTIRINYDASKDDYYLEIGLLSSQRYFTQKEFEYIWEVLTRYESDDNPKVEKMDRAIIG
ncbi:MULTISPECIES: hypothetical protein [Clostridium]|uniref:hypothetical protein n=1 Tax=Clostridium TaxID=1485 RepID=UPI0007DF826F|nr:MULTISPECIES: hypothetical protein [Clostridium]KEI91110.1 hypothetical protein N491_04000 [Clostridium botulinum B2 275]MBE6056851.1 hypothetical protein [Clostridium sp.]